MALPDQVTAFLTAICCVALLLILGTLTGLAYRRGQRLRSTILGLTLIHEFVLIVFPGCYAALSGFGIESGLGIAPDRLLNVYAGEVLFVFLFAVGLYFSSRTGRSTLKPVPYDEGPEDRYFLYALVGGAALLYIGRLFAPAYTYKDLETHYQIVVRSNALEVAADWGGTLVQWPGLFAAAIFAANRKMPRFWRLTGASVLLAQLVFAMIHGLRGGVVWAVSLIAVAGYYEFRHRMLLAAGILTLMLVPMFPWLHSTMRYASFGAPAGTSRWEMIPFLIQGMADPNSITEASSTGFVESWATRAEGPRNSSVLYALKDQGDGASYMPILGSIVLPFPRMWWVDKPVAGSTDTTNLGAAIYRVQQSKPNGSFYDMGPILASAHAYWEGGWAWLVAAALLTGLMWGRLFTWAEKARRRSIDILVLTFTAALPIDGFFSALNPVFTYCRLIWLTLVPLGLLLLLLRKVARARRVKAGGAVNARPSYVLVPSARAGGVL